MSLEAAAAIIVAAIVIGAVGALIARAIIVLMRVLLELVAIAGVLAIGLYAWWKIHK